MERKDVTTLVCCGYPQWAPRVRCRDKVRTSTCFVAMVENGFIGGAFNLGLHTPKP